MHCCQFYYFLGGSYLMLSPSHIFDFKDPTPHLHKIEGDVPNETNHYANSNMHFITYKKINFIFSSIEPSNNIILSSLIKHFYKLQKSYTKTKNHTQKKSLIPIFHCTKNDLPTSTILSVSLLSSSASHHRIYQYLSFSRRQ